MRYFKVPVEIEAVQWTGNNLSEIRDFMGYVHWSRIDGLHIPTLEDSKKAQHFATVGDYIVKGVCGEFYPCKAHIFELTHKPIKEKPMFTDPNKTVIICSLALVATMAIQAGAILLIASIV